MALTDIHQHIVFGVDDGPRDISGALKMLRWAQSQGVTTVVCTSHTLLMDGETDRSAYRSNLKALRAAAAAAVPGVTLLTGAENLITPEALENIEHGGALTLNETENFLCEFYPELPWQLLLHAAKVITRAGFRMVLAHAERYECLRSIDRVRQLKDETDAVIQLNADTILRSRHPLGGRWTRRMIVSGLADVAASDAHDTILRPCRLGEAHAFLTKHYDRFTADRLCITNPENLLTSRKESLNDHEK